MNSQFVNFFENVYTHVCKHESKVVNQFAYIGIHITEKRNWYRQSLILSLKISISVVQSRMIVTQSAYNRNV